MFTRLHHVFFSFLFLMQMTAVSVSADEVLRPRSRNELVAPNDVSIFKHYSTERAIRIEGLTADSVVYINEAALKRDFPQLRSLNTQQLKTWLVENFGYIGSQQRNLSGIRNTFIKANPKDTKDAFRPEGWRRSAVMEAMSPDGKDLMGLVDIKGFGHGDGSLLDAIDKMSVPEQITAFRTARGNKEKLNKLRAKDHSDGLLSLGEAIAEGSRQMAAQRLFETKDIPLETVETYAIFQLPFDIMKPGEDIPAAFYLRQAHRGRKSLLDVPNDIYVDTFGHRQQTSMGTAVDFGAVIITDERLVGNFGPIDGRPVLINSMEESGSTDPQKSKAWIYAHEVAKAVVSGDKDAIYMHYQEMLEPIKDAQIPDNRRQYSRVSRELVENQRLAGKDFNDIITPLSRMQSNHPYWQEYNELAEQIKEISKHAERNDVKSLQIIEKALNHPSSDIRARAARAMSGRTDAASLPLIDKALNDHERVVRVDAAYALRKRQDPTAIKLITKALNDSSSDVRITATQCDVFEDKKNTEILPLIEKALKDSDPRIRAEAVRVLNKRGVDSSVLEEVFYNDRALKVKTQVIESMTFRNEEAAVKFIIKATQDPDPNVVSIATQSLEVRTDKTATKVFKEILAGNNAEEQRVVLQSLKKRTDRTAKILLKKWDPKIAKNESRVESSTRVPTNPLLKCLMDALRGAGRK